MSPAIEKTSVKLHIFNQVYSLLVKGDPAEMEQAAHEVDELMTTIARSGNMETARIAVLACLHLQARVHTLEHEIAAIRTHVEDKTRHFSALLDDLITSNEEVRS